METVMTEPTGTAVATPEPEEEPQTPAQPESPVPAKPEVPPVEPPEPAAAEDYKKKFAGTQKSLNNLLKHIGVKDLDEAFSRDFAEPAPAAEPAKAAEPQITGAEPEMPDEEDFTDEFGELDKVAYRKAVAKTLREIAHGVYESDRASAVMEAEAEALGEEAGLVPAYIAGADEDEMVKTLIRGWAWNQNAGRPATRAELKVSREAVEAFVGRAVTARLAELEAEAKKGKTEEPPPSGAAPPAKGKPAGAAAAPDWAKMSEEERIAWMVNQAPPG